MAFVCMSFVQESQWKDFFLFCYKVKLKMNERDQLDVCLIELICTKDVCTVNCIPYARISVYRQTYKHTHTTHE